MIAATVLAKSGQPLIRWPWIGDHVDLIIAALLQHLGKRDVQGVLVEGGATLAWSLVRDRLIDDAVLYVAPIWFAILALGYRLVRAEDRLQTA